MKQIGLYALLLAALSSCDTRRGSGNMVSETRPVGNFNGLSASGSFEVEVKSGPAKLEIECDDNLADLVETNVHNGVLSISLKSHSGISDGHFKAYVTVPTLDEVRSSGAASIVVKDELKNSDKIDFEASGASSIKAQVDAPAISTDASGASNIEVSGKTKTYNAEASGSADVKTADLQSETSTVEASGAATVHVHASVDLDARASGAANIYYRGGGNMSQKTSGAGSINKED